MEVFYTFAGVLLDFDGTIIDSTEGKPSIPVQILRRINEYAAIVENWKRYILFGTHQGQPHTNNHRIGNELGIDHEEILRTSHGRRSIDVLQQLDPTKANWECMYTHTTFHIFILGDN